MGLTLRPGLAPGLFFTMNDNDRTAAVHESGHALIAHLLGHQVERAFIGEDLEGVVPPGIAEGGVVLQLVGDWRHAVFVAVAGWCAEEVAFPGIQADRGQDADFCRETLCQAGFSECHSEILIEWASAVARDQLRVHLTALEAVADWLSRYRDIDSETLAALIQAHG